MSSFRFLVGPSSCKKAPASFISSLFTLISSFCLTGFFGATSSSISTSSLFRFFMSSSSNTHSIPFHTSGMFSFSCFSLSFFNCSIATNSSVFFFSSIIFISLFCLMSSAVKTDCFSMLDISTRSFFSVCQ